MKIEDWRHLWMTALHSDDKTDFFIPANIDKAELAKGLAQVSWAMYRPEYRLDQLINDPDREVISTKEAAVTVPGRRKGNTTRMADAAIQIIMSGKKCKIVDTPDHPGSHDRLFRIVMDRLRMEHSGANIEFDKATRTIWLGERLDSREFYPVFK